MVQVHREPAARNQGRKRARELRLSVWAVPPPEDNRPVGSRLWLYANFDCNLHCDYCCVRSSPTVPRRELGLARVQRIAREAPELGVKEIFVTGGEPFLLEDIGEILACCAAAASTTVLTNGMLFAGRRAESLGALPRDRIVLQISLDSATPELHDLHRGRGSWARARDGIQRARAQGFRVRLAATVSTDTEAEQFRQSYAGSLCAVLQPKVSPLAEPISCRKLRLPLSVCTGIQSERRMPICLSPARFSPVRSVRCGSPRLRPRRRTRE
jgi:hypothetical protein